jgi:chaperonin GroEL (HSP60 family)
MVMELLLVELVQGINTVEDLEQEQAVMEVTEGFQADFLDLVDLV